MFAVKILPFIVQKNLQVMEVIFLVCIYDRIRLNYFWIFDGKSVSENRSNFVKVVKNLSFLHFGS